MWSNLKFKTFFYFLLFGVIAALPVHGETLPQYTGPLFDVHSHVKPEGSASSASSEEERVNSPFRRGKGRMKGKKGPRAGNQQQQDTYTASDLVLKLKGVGVTGMILFAPEKIVLAAQAQYPDFVYPFISPPRDPSTHSLKFGEADLKQFETSLSNPLIRGVGEFSLRHKSSARIPGSNEPADSAGAVKVYQMAIAAKKPVNVHVENSYAGELKRALDQNKEMTLIWAHIGDGPASLIRDMMRTYPNLYADISCQNPYFPRSRDLAEQSLANPDGTIKKEWKEAFEEFPDRFLFGLDITSQKRFNQIDQLIAYYRTVLGHLKPETAEKIAHLNAKRLLGI